MTMERFQPKKGSRVRFRLADVFLPNAEVLRAALHEEESIEGVVIDFSDSGSSENAFALIEVVLKNTVVVPVEKLQLDSLRGD
jgi:hypothetical protein